MGVDAHLLINAKWGLEDLVELLSSYQGIKATIRSCHKTAPGYYMLMCDNERTINCFLANSTPLGTCHCLSLRSNKEAIQMLRGIAKVLGGFLNERDTDEDYERIEGMFFEEDGLPYFYKYGVIHNQLKDNDDQEGLSAIIEAWNKEYR